MVIKKQITAAMQSAKHSLEVEEFKITREHEELVEKRLNNEITEEEFLEEVRRRIKKGQ
ncbi:MULTISPECIES: hypothetical protein [Bacillus cereus group]|uniref:hypothetical protein n=1 Tax=Bacillus cereus group TaxID=86661 RepID=UPI001E43301C|nr:MULTISPECIES: hypothetical protein [Bacillus cereus group]MCC2414294.1 hypothetical protein [Bacillus paranthracis]MDX5923210.1 hypothetical protein [Bacillus cereus group sp. BfR-BA-01033]